MWSDLLKNKMASHAGPPNVCYFWWPYLREDSKRFQIYSRSKIPKELLIQRWEYIKENKKERKQGTRPRKRSRKQENKNSPKKATKKKEKKIFFLDDFLGLFFCFLVLTFLFSFINSHLSSLNGFVNFLLPRRFESLLMMAKRWISFIQSTETKRSEASESTRGTSRGTRVYKRDL